VKQKIDQKWYPENFDWYLKWAASVIVMMSLAMRSARVEYRLYDISLGTVGIALWLWVSIIWQDRALIMLNAVSLFMLLTTLFREL